MTHNDVLRSIRYLLNISDAALLDIIRLGGREVGKVEIVAFLKKEDEPVTSRAAMRCWRIS
jgi:uncharacterized protein YehS (DUF1456 family)